MGRARLIGAMVVVLLLAGCRRGAEVQQPPGPLTGDDAAPGGDSRLSPLVTLASDEHEPYAIAADASFVWWGAGGNLRRAPVGGGAAETWAAELGPIEGIALDASHVYVITSDGDDLPLASGRLLAIARADGAQTVLATGLTRAGDVVVDGDEVFFSNGLGTVEFDDETGQVLAVARGGGATRVVADRQATPFRLAVDAQHVYFTNYGGTHSVNRVPRGGGAVEVLAEDLGTPTSIALVGDEVLVNSMFGPALWRVPRGGGEARAIHAGGAGNAVVVVGDDAIIRTEAGAVLAIPLDGGPMRALAFDRTRADESLVVSGDTLFFTNLDDATIKAVALGGGLLVLGTLEKHHPRGLAVDAEAVYFLDTDNGHHADVVRTAEPDRLVRAPLDGGAREILWSTSSDDELLGIAVDATGVYVSDVDVGRVVRLDHRGGDVTEVIGGLQAPGVLAIADRRLYVATADAIVRVPLAGGAAEIVVTRPGRAVAAMMVHDDRLVFVDDQSGEVLSVASSGGTPAVIARLPADLDVATIAGDLVYGVDRTTQALVAVSLTDGSTRALGGPAGRVGGLAVVGGDLVLSSDAYRVVVRMSR